MPLTLVTDPAETPVSLAEACAHLRLDVGHDDDTVSALIAAATGRLDGKDGILGRALVTQTWRLTLPRLDFQGVRLPLSPVQSVAEVGYVDGGGASQILDPGQYVLSGDRLMPTYDATWPVTRAQVDAVHIDFVAGYGAAAAVPAPIKQAILLTVGHWYDNRSAVMVGGSVQGMPLAVDALTAPYRTLVFG